MTPPSDQLDGRQAAARGYPKLMLAVLAAGVAAIALDTRECFVDDAFTGFQYIGNLLAGQGLVFQSGRAPVEGVSNVGWLLLLAPLCAMVGPAVAAKAVGSVLLLAALGATIWLGKGLAAKMENTEDSSGFGLTLAPAFLLAASFPGVL